MINTINWMKCMLWRYNFVSESNKIQSLENYPVTIEDKIQQ